MAFDLTLLKQKISSNIFPNNERRISAIKLLEVLETLTDTLDEINVDFTSSLYINDLRANTNQNLKIVFILDENQFGAFIRATENLGRPDNGLNVVKDVNGNEWLRVQDPYASIGEATEQALALKENFIVSSSVSNYWAGNKTWVPFPTIPSNTNQLTNGAGFATSSSVNTIVSASISNFSSSVVVPQSNAPATAGYILSGSIIRKDNTLYNILDRFTSEYVTYTKVTTYADGTAMSDGKCDGVIYAKLGSEYFKRNYIIITPEMFGAKGDGVSNDTVALQTAITFCTGKSLELHFKSNSTYLINDELIITPSTGWKLLGNGCTIKQNTNNKSIIKLRVTAQPVVINNFKISGFRLQWTNDQDYATHSSSFGIAFEATADNGYGFYNYEIDKINIVNGVYGIGISSTSIITTVWGTNIHDIIIGSKVSGAAIKLWYSPAAGMPNYRIINMYVRCDSMNEPFIDIRQASSVVLDNIELNWINTLQNTCASFTTINNLHIGTIRIEQGSFTRNYAGMINFSGVTNGVIENIEIQNITFNTTNYAYIIRESSSNPNTFFTVKNVTLRNNTLSGGIVNIVQAGSSRATITGNVILDIASEYVYRYDNSWLNVDVQCQNKNTISGDNGDNNVTLIKSSPFTQIFASDINSARTLTFPSSSLYNGFGFNVLKSGLGSGSLNINNLVTVPGNTKAYLQFAYTRGGNTPAWTLRSYSPIEPSVTMPMTASGDGSATAINLAHGLGVTPTFFNVVATNAAAGSIGYVTANSTNIVVNYSVAPVSGSANLSYNVTYRK